MKPSQRSLGRFALSQVAIAALVMASSTAWAVGLGRLSVQSNLGESLKAEIDVSSLSSEEAGTLKVRIASPDAYRASGVDYNSALASAQVQLLRRADGRPYLRVSSDRAIQEPFIDVILELNWASGRLVREYTLLIDPPNLARAPAPAVSTAPVISAAPEARPVAPQPAPTAAPIAAAPAPRAAQPAAPATPAPKPRTEVVAPKVAKAAPAPAPVAPPVAAPAPAVSEYKVKPGDTLWGAANQVRSGGISLDQMLVGLFRGNPDAFMGDNMNRLKAGAVLQVPANESVQKLSPDEAREVVLAQSADFAAYRQRLASGVTEVKAGGNERQAKGQVQAAVEDRKPAASPTPDKLTLSKAGTVAPEAKLSKDSEKKADAERVAELTRNVEALKQISSDAKPAPGASSGAALGMATAVPASAPASAAAPVMAKASVPAVAAPAPRVADTDGGVVDQLMDSPYALPLAGVLVALLGGFGLMRMRGRAKPAADTGFHESRLQPDSFFGASGGQRVDTRDASTGAASSMSYSLSQLDAIGDVDPVAEADVYLAYGRDLQAEEILKEALRATPERLAIRIKLLEVYAKRRDTKGFEQLAIQLYAETQGQGEDWARAQELGRQIDSDNPLYQPGGAPSSMMGLEREIHPEPMNASTLPQTAQQSTLVGAHLATEPIERGEQDVGAPSGMDLDLDLDLMADATQPEPSAHAMEATQAMPASVEQAPMHMDFDLDQAPAGQGADLEFDIGELELPEAGAAEAPAAGPAAEQSLDFDLGSIDLDLPEIARPEAPEAPAAVPATAEMPMDDALAEEFDSTLQGGVGDPLAQAFDALEDDGSDPLQRQLELADEFRQIGDTEGARDVLQELLGKASGPLKDKAQAMLDELR